MKDSEINLEDLAKLTKLLKLKRSKEYYAKRLGVDVKTVYQYLSQLRKLRKNKLRHHEKKENFITGVLESIKEISFEPNSHEELAIVHNVDLTVFKIINYWSKLQTNGNFTSSIFCKRKILCKNHL